MSAVLEPGEDDNNSNNDDLKDKQSLSSSNILDSYNYNVNLADLPIEKRFTHIVFCQQIQNIDLDAAKQLLAELHMLLLGRQAVMTKIAKQDLTIWMNYGQ